jgi:UDP-N-acetylmuramate--alanine ligase
VALFQPHLFSRTRDFQDDFGTALAAADVNVVMDVYPSRERPIPGVTGELVAEAARRAGHAKTIYTPEKTRAVDCLEQTPNRGPAGDPRSGRRRKFGEEYLKRGRG